MLYRIARQVLKSVATGAGAMVRKFPEFTRTAVTASLRMLAEVTDEDWDGANCDPLDESEQVCLVCFLSVWQTSSQPQQQQTGSLLVRVRVSHQYGLVCASVCVCG